MSLPPRILPSDAVWLVTGTSSGIGASLLSAIFTSQPTARIIALSRNPSKIPLPASSTSSNTHLVAIDLTSEESISVAFESALQRFGKIDVVINNAGHGLLVSVTRHALRIMRSQTPVGGVIAQVSSIGGYISAPGQGYYHASKWALEGFTESVSKELDPEWKIRFVVFEPGSVKTAYSTGNMGLTKRHEAYRRPEGRELPMEKLGLRRIEMEEKVGAKSEDVARVMVETVIDRDGRWGGRGMLRLPIGADAWALEKKDVEDVGASLEDWREISERTSSGNAKEVLRAVGLMKH